MRVLIPHSGNLRGGVETALLALARLRDLQPGFEPEFALCFDDRPFASELRETGAPVHDLGAVRLSRPLSVARARRRLAQLAERGAYDVCVLPSAWTATVYAPAVRACRLPMVFWAHDAWHGSWLERLAARHRPDLVIANSHFTAASLSSLLDGVPTEVAYYPVEPPSAAVCSRDDVRATLDTPADAIVIVQVGRMERWKGHELTIRALERLPRGLPWIWWVVGGAQRPVEARYREQLAARVSRAGLDDRVRWAGHRADVPDVLRAADVFCQPNEGPEPFGLVFVEALYAGLPVVATRLGGAEEIVDDTCGRLVPPADPAALARTLEQLVADAALRRRLGGAGPARAFGLTAPAAQMARIASCLRAAAAVPVLSA